MNSKDTKRVETAETLPAEQADFFKSLNLGHPGVVMAPPRCGAGAYLVPINLLRSHRKVRGYAKPTPWPQK